MSVVAVVPEWRARADTGGLFANRSVLHMLATLTEVRVLVVADQPSTVPLGDGLTRLVACRRRSFGIPEQVFGGLPTLGLWARGVDAPSHILRTIDDAAADTVLIENTYRGVNLPKQMKQRLIVFTHNVEWARLQAFARRASSPLKQVWTNLQSRRMRRLEQRVLRRAHSILAVSNRDIPSLRELAGSQPRILRVPIPPHPALLQLPLTGRPPETVLFIGSLDYPPNEAAAIDLALTVLPAVRRVVPHTSLVLAGRNPSTALREVINHSPGVRLIADFADEGELFAQATVFAAPLPLQEGVPVKLIQAFASGTPVVTTPALLRAVGEEARDSARMATTSDEFVTEIIGLLRDETARVSLAMRARHHVKEAFSLEGLETVLREALAQ